MPSPYQIGSRTCGCVDCIEDYPTAQYGDRLARATCAGPWQVRYTAGRTRRQKTFRALADANLFLEEAKHGA